MSTPTEVEALMALRTLTAWLGIGSAPASNYTQDSRPLGVSRDAYLRRHRIRMRARTPGWTRCGQARLVTASAWEADVAAETATAAERRPRPALAIVPPPSGKDQIAAQLGIRLRGAR
jgi:hypothetical protein